VNWMTPTTYLHRLGDAMEILCGGHRPPDEMLGAWLNECDDRLQEFACDHGPAWAQGIVVIDAARVLADSPGEGVEHELLPMRRCRHGVVHPHECRECEAEATPEEIAAFMAAEGLTPNAELCGARSASERTPG